MDLAEALSNDDPGPNGLIDSVTRGYHAGAKAHFEAAALHASVSELHMLAAASHVQGDHELANYYAKLVSGDSERAHEVSLHAVTLSSG